MAEDRNALLQSYRETREALLAAIAGLSDAQVTEPTLAGWSVKDHLAHLAFWDDIRATEVTRISAGHASTWCLSDADDGLLNTMAYTLRRDLSLDQLRWELETSRGRLLDAIGAATDRGLDPSLYGGAGLASGHEAEHTAWIMRWRAEKGI